VEEKFMKCYCIVITGSGAHIGEGRKAEGLQTQKTPETTKNQNKKNTFLETTISNFFFNFTFRRNHPQNSPDDQYIRMLKNELIINKRTRS
jgi:hypothetical protein